MNAQTENIGQAITMIYDELKSDSMSTQIIIDIDESDEDDIVKNGIRNAVRRLRELNKGELADKIERLTKGYAF